MVEVSARRLGALMGMVAVAALTAGCGGGGGAAPPAVPVSPVPSAPVPAAPAVPLRSTFDLNDTGVEYASADANRNNTACVGAFIGQQDCDNGRDRRGTTGFPTVSKVGAGVAGFDFTKLDARGNALDASALTWSCVRDNVTQLVWDAQWNPGANNFADGRAGSARAYAAQVRSAGRCGRADWRVPTLLEVQSLVHYGVDNAVDIFNPQPLIDTTYFQATTVPYWTAHASTRYPNAAWALRADGTVDVVAPLNSAYAVRLVSAPMVDLSTRFIPPGNGSQVVDDLHGLIWRRCLVGQNWNGARCTGTATRMDWLAALSLEGALSAWRVPNIKELASLINPDKAVGTGVVLVDEDAFPGIDGSEMVWSSTPSSALGFDSLAVDLRSGQVSYGGDRSTLRTVLLVRNR
jgi:Protein of unknown function (DUF1566)